MAFDRKQLKRYGNLADDMFQMLTYDAAASTVSPSGSAGDTTADITAGTGAGYFPADILPKFVDGTQVTGENPTPPNPMVIIAVKTANNTDGSEPAVGLFAVNVVLTSTSTGSGAATVTTYTTAKHTDGRVKTRCQLLAAGQITADNTND